MNLVCGCAAGRVLAAVVCVLALVSPAFADGKVFRTSTAVVPMVDQEAVICFDKGVEVLAIRTRADASAAKGEPLAWVVPVPAVPDLLPTTPGVFDTARALTMPRLMRGDQAGVGWLVLGVSVFILLVAASLRSDSASSVGSRVALMIFWIIIGLFLIFMMLPTMAKSRGAVDGPSTGGVEVLKRERIGTLDVSVVRSRDGADSAKSLAAWLKDAGCAVPPAAEPALADYAARGWVFVAARLTEPAAGARVEPTPLVMRFATPAPVYPMKLTGVGNGELGLELCVLAPGTAGAPGMRVARSSPLRADVDYTSDDVPLVHEGLKGLADAAGVGAGAWITRLTGRLQPADQTADMAITVNPGQRQGEALYTPAGARRIGSQWGAGVAAVGMIGVAFALGVSSPTPRRAAKWVGVSLAAGLLVTAAVASGLPQYGGAIKTGRRPERLLHSMVHELEEARSSSLTDVRAFIASKRAAGTEPFVSIPPEGDVPGGYVLKDDDGRVWIDLYNQYGQGGYTYPVGLSIRSR